MKFKVGDKVKTYFGYEGEIVFIEKSKDIPYVVKMKGFNGHDGEGWGYRYVNEDGLEDKWWFLEDQLELLENKKIIEVNLKRDLIKIMFKKDFKELFLKIIDFVEEINGRYGIEIEASEVAKIIVEEYKEVSKC